jgi:hypothetical protein
MELPEAASHSFIVKVWLERMSAEGRGTVWRGQITHVPDGERRSFDELDEIIVFMTVYLEKMGVRLNHLWYRRWVRRLRKGIKRIYPGWRVTP